MSDEIRYRRGPTAPPTRIETALSRMLLEEHGDHNPACIDTGCPVAAELVDVAERSLATQTGAALGALVEAAEAWDAESPDYDELPEEEWEPSALIMHRAAVVFRAATEPAGGER